MKKIVKKFLSHIDYELTKNYDNDIPLYIKHYGDESVVNRRFYNISAGTAFGFGGGLYHPCWTNIDVDRPWKNDWKYPNSPEFDPKKDIAHDLLNMKPIPVESATAELVHSRFATDRITDDAALYFFNEVYRMLKPGGVFRIISTNSDLDLRAYLNNDMDFYYWHENWNISIEQAFLYHVATQTSTLYHDPASLKITDDELKEQFKCLSHEEVLEYCTSKCSVEIHKNNRYDHFNWWNEKKYNKMLSQAGFQTIYHSAAEQSAAPVMRNEIYFDNEYNNVMMYMEAIKL